MNRNKEQSGRMLSHLISKAPQLIRPYMQPIIAVLIPKLKEPDQNLGVVISILTAVGDIALVCEIVESGDVISSVVSVCVQCWVLTCYK